MHRLNILFFFSASWTYNVNSLDHRTNKLIVALSALVPGLRTELDFRVSIQTRFSILDPISLLILVFRSFVHSCKRATLVCYHHPYLIINAICRSLLEAAKGKFEA